MKLMSEIQSPSQKKQTIKKQRNGFSLLFYWRKLINHWNTETKAGLQQLDYKFQLRSHIRWMSD